MAAPSVTARPAPDGLKMRDGHPTLVALARFPDIAFWERTVTPPGIDGGDAVDTVTMHNDEWRTKGPRRLKEMTESTFTAAWDPVLYTDLQSVVNELDSVTYHFPEGSAVAVWGWVRVAEPQEMSEGEMPEIEITIEISNEDPDGNEEGPVVQSVAGT